MCKLKLGKLVNFHLSLFHNLAYAGSLTHCDYVFKRWDRLADIQLWTVAASCSTVTTGVMYSNINQLNCSTEMKLTYLPTIMCHCSSNHQQATTIHQNHYFSIKLTERFSHRKMQFAGITTCCFEKHTCVKDWETMQDRIYTTAKWSKKNLKIRR